MCFLPARWLVRHGPGDAMPVNNFTYSAIGGGRGLQVRHGGQGVADFVFGLPEGSRLDSDDVSVAVGEVGVLLRQRGSGDRWLSEIVLDNSAADEVKLPDVDMVVRVEQGWTGWSWTAGAEGFLVVAPESGDGEPLLVRLRQGFLRACAPVPAFASHGDALGPGSAAFALTSGSLRGFGRCVTTLEFGPIPDLDAAGAAIPSWVPGLVVAPGDEVRFEAPDQALVVGPGVSVVECDGASLVTALPGHRELAVHGPRGITRLLATFTPELDALAAEVAAGLVRLRPAALQTTAAAVVAAALSRRAIADPDAALDWLEGEDWLAREDQFGPLVATTIAAETRDRALGEAAMTAIVERRFGRGDGLIASWAWLGALRLGIAPLDLSRVLARAATTAERWEAALIRQEPGEAYDAGVQTLIRQLGGVLPGQPMGLDADEAGLSVALLRAVPEHARVRAAATATAEKAAAELAADYADGAEHSQDAMAWLIWSS